MYRLLPNARVPRVLAIREASVINSRGLLKEAPFYCTRAQWDGVGFVNAEEGGQGASKVVVKARKAR